MADSSEIFKVTYSDGTSFIGIVVYNPAIRTGLDEAKIAWGTSSKYEHLGYGHLLSAEVPAGLAIVVWTWKHY